MSESAKYLILFSSFLVLAISFAIGLWAKKKVTSPEEFFGGAKIFGPLTVGLATMAAVGSAFAWLEFPAWFTARVMRSCFSCSPHPHSYSATW